ncbi:MAG: CBS domain-containing protein [Methanobacteriota archaeon]|nr:MAG: CBS domain-containing protein [Euryarchaeota archaeon]
MVNQFNNRVPVMEVMSRSPVTITEDETVSVAAAKMRDMDVSSLIVVEGSKVIGIMTDYDVVHKVVAQDLLPSKLKVKEIMTAPVVTIHQHEGVEEAAAKMSKEGIRRLVVTDDSDLQGIVTENDILKIWPELIEVTREYQKVGLTDVGLETASGYCESCNVFSGNLVEIDGQLVCPECRER